jgi:chromosome segregation ATPase
VTDTMQAALEALLRQLADARARADKAEAERDENERAMAVWRGRTQRAEAEAARLQRVVRAARAYYVGYCQDEAESRDCCVDGEQHDAAQELRDALAALGEPAP